MNFVISSVSLLAVMTVSAVSVAFCAEQPRQTVGAVDLYLVDRHDEPYGSANCQWFVNAEEGQPLPGDRGPTLQRKMPAGRYLVYVHCNRLTGGAAVDVYPGLTNRVAVTVR